MEAIVHPLQELFQQLGLPATPAEIETFIAERRPLPSDITLCDAPFWTPTQAAFLREGISDDADWAATIDTLATLLSG